MLQDFVYRTAIGVPDFNSVEYWLQRRATLLLFDQAGIAPFCENISSVRADLILFIALLRPVSDKDKAALLSAIDQLETKDLRSDSFSVRVWLETGDL